MPRWRPGSGRLWRSASSIRTATESSSRDDGGAMNYFIKRDLQEYGPYTLSELQRYVASGNVLLTDLCRSEGLSDWVPVSQVIGNIPVPVAAPQPVAGTVYGGPVAYGGAQAGYTPQASSQYPPPPSLHWGLVVLL